MFSSWFKKKEATSLPKNVVIKKLSIPFQQNPEPVNKNPFSHYANDNVIGTLAVLPNGRLASTESKCKVIRVWNIKKGVCEQALPYKNDAVLAVLPDGRLVSGGYSDNTIRVWDVTRGVCEQTLLVGRNCNLLEGDCNVRALAVFPDGRLVSVSREDSEYNTIRVWNVTRGVCEQTLPERRLQFVRALVVLPDGRLAIGGGYGDYTKVTATSGLIHIWNVTRGVCEQTLLLTQTLSKREAVIDLTVLLDGRLVSASSDNMIRVWDVTRGVCEQTLLSEQTLSNPGYCPLTVLPDGRLVSGGYSDNTIRVWDVTRGVCELILSKHTKPVRCLTILPDGHLASGSVDNTVRLWDVDLKPKIDVSIVRFEQQQPPSASLALDIETIFSNELIIQRELGRGGFGIVCEALWRGVKVAVKQLSNSALPENVLDEFTREAKIHARLRHPHIVALYGVCLERTKYAMVMELMTQGSLYSVLHSSKNLPWTQRINIALDATAGLLFLHGRNILHRDLKSLNVLLDGQGRAKLSDFGLSKVKIHTASTTKGNPVGTLYWMAPELFDINSSCNKETDIYAMGILLWEIASRKLPYESANGNQAIVQHWVESGKREKIPASTPKKLTKLITQCWAQHSSDRPSAQEMINALN